MKRKCAVLALVCLRLLAGAGLGATVGSVPVPLAWARCPCIRLGWEYEPGVMRPHRGL